MARRVLDRPPRQAEWRAVLLVTACAAVAGLDLGAVHAIAVDPVARLKATYAALTSYHDTGTVLIESQFPGTSKTEERFEFTTAFQRPSQFAFLFRPVAGAEGDAYAAWSVGERYESWWAATGVHETYPKERTASAVLAGAYPTKGASVNIPSLLFPRAELHSTIWDFTGERESPGTLNGRATTVFAGSSGGHFGARRPVTLWVDNACGLVLQIQEDTPEHAVRGSLDRVTTTIVPVANAVLPPTAFTFVPPKGH